MALPTWANRLVTATPVSVLFFPQRLGLRLDGKRYSPAVTERMVAVGGSTTSFAVGSKMLELLMDLKVSAKTVNTTTVTIGNELTQQRDASADAYQARPLTQPATVAQPPIAIACVEVDGGRMQTRTPGQGVGVHDPHWRENKNAGFFRMQGECFASDPCPALPSCFTDRKRLKGLLVGWETPVDETVEEPLANPVKPDLSWRPKSQFRTCISSLSGSDRFGELMAAEANQRGFYSADRRAFLGDGLAYNWTIQQQHFPQFEPILDFIHPLERLHETSRSLYDDGDEAWAVCLKWMELCWNGDTQEVIGELSAEQAAMGLPDAATPETDARSVVAETLTYLRNNVSRMDYPAYRQAGLPISSCLIESQVKEMNKRVKGTEKFWNDGAEGEAILQVKAALISDDARLTSHMHRRPGSLFARPTRKNREPALT
jgi:hypothetical protein